MCTSVRFTDASKQNMYWGRNLDWSVSYGQKVIVIPAAYKYSYKYAGERSTKNNIIGMAVVADDMPLFLDCANDKGLAVGGLNFPGKGFAKYEDNIIEGKINIPAYELPLWIASEFETVDEVEAAITGKNGESEGLAIINIAPTPQFSVSLLHWIVADKTRCIVIEYKEDGLHVFHDDIDVLTNQPDFDWHLENLRNYIALTSDVPAETTWSEHNLQAFGSGFGINALPGGFSSPSRFVRVAYLNSHYPAKDTEEENVSRLFHTLTGVAMIEGGAKMTDGEYEKTVYTGGYSQLTKTYYWNDYDNPTIRSVTMDEVLVQHQGEEGLIVC